MLTGTPASCHYWCRLLSGVRHSRPSALICAGISELHAVSLMGQYLLMPCAVCMQQSWTRTDDVIYEGFACTAPQPEEGQGVMYRLF